MAEGKKSFLLYCDLIHTVKKLPDEKAGQLLKHILSYVNDENPETDDLLIEIAFEPIKHQLKRDLEKWEDKKDGFSDAGKESGKARKLLKPQLYVLRFFNDDEEFLKVGITDYSIGRRYSSSGEGGSKLGYRFEILHQYFPIKNQSLVDIEKGVEQTFKKHKYVPIKQFGGHLECYNIKITNELIHYLTTLNDVQQGSTKRTVNDTVNGTVTVNVNDNVLVSEKKEVGLGFVVFNAEEEISKNQIEFQRICSVTGKSIDAGKISLHKYHLYLEEKEQYPKGKKAVFAGFEKWLLNEKNFSKNGTGKENRVVGRDPVQDKL